jgi:hypothetical protein
MKKRRPKKEDGAMILDWEIKFKKIFSDLVWLVGIIPPHAVRCTCRICEIRRFVQGGGKT